MIPLIEREIIDHRHWVERNDFTDLLTLAQSAPGPISLNTAVFVGYKIRGWQGAVTAMAGIVIPSFVIILLIAVYFSDFRHNPTVESAFQGMRPAVVALIAAPIIHLAKGLNWWKIPLALAAAAGVWLLGISPIYFLVAGALAGIVYSFYDKKGGAK